MVAFATLRVCLVSGPLRAEAVRSLLVIPAQGASNATQKVIPSFAACPKLCNAQWLAAAVAKWHCQLAASVPRRLLPQAASNTEAAAASSFQPQVLPHLTQLFRGFVPSFTPSFTPSFGPSYPAPSFFPSTPVYNLVRPVYVPTPIPPPVYVQPVNCFPPPASPYFQPAPRPRPAPRLAPRPAPTINRPSPYVPSPVYARRSPLALACKMSAALAAQVQLDVAPTTLATLITLRLHTQCQHALMPAVCRCPVLAHSPRGHPSSLRPSG